MSEPKLKSPVLFFSSLVHGGGKTFAETYAKSLKDFDITLSTLYDREFTKELASRLGLKSTCIFSPKLLLDPNTLVLSNSQACAAIASIFYPGRHYYVSHGYANGLAYAPTWRRRLWAMQVNMPGTRIIACGDTERDVVSKLLLNKEKVSLIRNGLPHKIRENGEVNIHYTKRQAHFAYIGRISFQKGLDLLLRAMLMKEIRLRNIRLSIIGNYQEGEMLFCKEVRRLIKENDANIELLPPQNIDATFYRKFSAIISPSRFEGLPFTLLEAAYVGTPLIVSDCPGNIDVALDDEHAYIFRAGDVSSLSTALLSFLDASQHEVQERACRMRERACTEFSDSSFRDAYLKLLN